MSKKVRALRYSIKPEDKLCTIAKKCYKHIMAASTDYFTDKTKDEAGHTITLLGMCEPVPYYRKDVVVCSTMD